jgi:hypothetical protein
LIDISELFGFAKKSDISLSSPNNGIESGNSRRKKSRRSSRVLRDVIIDSGINNVQVNDLSYD